MITLEQFKKEFDRRHDFKSEDIDKLQYKYPNVKLKNIPLAWVIIIDDLLKKANGLIKEIRQEFGQFIAIQNSFSITNDISELINSHENKIKQIDADLHKAFS